MSARPLPRLPGLAPTSADRLLRTRILALRASRRGQDRLEVLRPGDAQGSTLASWAPSAPARPARGDAARPGTGTLADVALRLLAAAPAVGTPVLPALVVRTREGPAEETSGDLAWCRALVHAASVLERPGPTLVVLTRWGWATYPDRRRRTWARLRGS